MTSVLVVDDEAIVATDIAQRLKRSGYDVPAVAATGEAALRMTEELHPDLILMDILLKGEADGIETARKIQDKFDIPIVFLTGQADESTLERVGHTSNYGFLLKPIDAASLFPTVEMALTRHAFTMRLKDSENRFRAVADSAAEAIFSIDMQGNVIYWNKAAESTFGWNAGEILGQSVTAIIPESNRAGFLKVLPTMDTTDTSKTYVPSSSILWRRKDGTEFPTEPSFASWKTKEGTFATAIVRDLSEQKAIFDALQAGIVLIDPITHKIVDVNATAAHLFGAPKEAIIGSVCHRFICPAAAGSCPITDLGQTVDKAERVMPTADGKSRPILKSVSKITLGGHAYLLESFIDISDRKQIKLALRESEAYYRAIFESTAMGMAIVEEDMTVAKANSKLEQLTGFSKNEVEGLKPWTDFVAPEDLEVMKTHHGARRRDEDSAPKEYEFRLLTKDGTQREAFVTVALIPGTQRSVVSIVDVTTLKIAQEASRKQAAMLNAAHDAVMTLDLKGAITYWNRGAERLYGWTKEEAEGQDANALLKTKFPESREVLWPKLIESGLWEGGLTHVTRDNVPVAVMSRWTLLKDEKGNASAILEINNDITERKKAESALAESDEKLRITFATMVDGLWTTGLDRKVIDCNEAAVRLTQRSKEEMIGKPFLDLFAPDFHSQLLETMPELIEKGSIRTTFPLLRKNGESVEIEANISLIKDVAGQPTAFLTVARDVTERKRAEEALVWESAINSTIALLFTPLITPTSTLEDIALAILDEAKHLTGSEAGFVSLIDPVNRDMVSFGLTQMMLNECAIPEEKRQVRFPIGADGSYSALWGYALNSKKGFYTNAPATHPAAQGTPDGHAPLAQFLAAPALVGGIIEGEIALANPGRDYTGRDLTAVERLADVFALAVIRTQEEDEIKASLKERETLLKEIHHRVKNNMQIISSLLSLQAAQAKEPETIEMLNESQRRIRSMALIHETLYRSGSLAEIDFGEYVEGLIQELLRMYNVPLGVITITTDIKNIQFGVDTAIPCALIINELVSNCLKYAFPDGRTGEVTIALQRANGAHTLTVADNGVGIPADLDFRTTDSLGMQLVVTLVNQLEGTIELDRENGTAFAISFGVD